MAKMHTSVKFGLHNIETQCPISKFVAYSKSKSPCIFVLTIMKLNFKVQWDVCTFQKLKIIMNLVEHN
jgi:hypothetical protein